MNEAVARRRIAELRLSTPNSLRSAGHLLLAWTSYAVAAFIAMRVDNLAVRSALWFVMAWLLVGNGAIVHETLHGHLFNSSKLNRVVGVIAGSSVGLPFSLYRSYHLGHHQYSCTADDPEGAPYRFTHRLYYALVPLGGPLFALQFVWWTAKTMFGRPPVFVRSSRNRMAVLVDGLFGLAFYAAMVVLGVVAFDVLLAVWLVPWLIAIVVLEPFVLLPEHYGADEADASSAMLTTRTVHSSRLVTWVYWSNNLHTAHHLAPGVVPQNIGKVDEEFVAPSLAPEWTASGYLAFHWRTLRSLPWRPSDEVQPASTR